MRRIFLSLTKLKTISQYRLQHQHHFNKEVLNCSSPLPKDVLKSLSLAINEDVLVTGIRPRKKSKRIIPSSGQPLVTKTYIRICEEKPKLLQESQNLLVVLDLNGTLLHRPSRNATRFIARPHGLEFLKRCVDKFYIVIWSSAVPANVKKICNSFIPPNLQNRLVAIWGRDKFGLSPREYNQRVFCYKRLTNIWNDIMISRSHPEYLRGARWNQTNTVLIDDSSEKGESEPYNLIKVPEFTGDINEADDILHKTYNFLCHLSMYSNVSSYLHQERPFSMAKYHDKV